MASLWFYESLGQVIGPLKPSDMIRDIRAGKIGFDTRVRKDDSQWVAASEVNGLLEAALRDVVEYRCPFCATRIPKPPSECLGCDRRVEETYLIQAAFPSLKKSGADAKPTGDGAGKTVKNWAKSLFGKNG